MNDEKAKSKFKEKGQSYLETRQRRYTPTQVWDAEKELVTRQSTPKKYLEAK